MWLLNKFKIVRIKDFNKIEEFNRKENIKKMSEQHLAFCGDALAQLIVGEEITWNKSYRIKTILSNKAMTKAWCKITKTPFLKNNFPIGMTQNSYHKRTGTKFEAMLYRVYVNAGYDCARGIVTKYLLKQK